MEDTHDGKIKSCYKYDYCFYVFPYKLPYNGRY
jgi:hypothetical protein